MRREDGMTLIEVFMAMALAAILVTLGAWALRHYWMVQSIDSAADAVVTQMRAVQERVTSESNPLVYGIRLRNGSSNWDVIRFDPKGAGTADDVCRFADRNSFSAGVEVTEASFSLNETLPEAVACRNLAGVETTDQLVFFYARGTAVAGSLKVHQPALGTGRDKTITVIGLTGKVSHS